MSGRIDLIVTTQFQAEVKVGIKQNVPLMVLFDKLCCKYNLDKKNAQLIFNNKLLNLKNTPAELKLKNNDEINLVMSAVGGSDT